MWLYPTGSFPSMPELGIKGIEQTQEEENAWPSLREDAVKEVVSVIY